MTEKGDLSKLRIGPAHLEWLASVLGLYAVSERPALEELVSCLPSMALLGFSSGAEIVREGDPGEEMFILSRGEAEVLHDGARVATLVSGDFFGEVGFLVSVPRTATVRAVQACEVFRIHPQDFDVVVKRYPPLMEVLRRTAKERMQKLMGK